MLNGERRQCNVQETAGAFSYQLLSAGTSTGAHAEEADGASSHDDFIAKNRIALKEAKETHFRLRVCRRCDFLGTSFDPLVQESDELVRILAKIVHKRVAQQTTATQIGPHGLER